MGTTREMTVREVARLTGVSVRTLHHYHKIGLLLPSRVSGAGYRFYDAPALERLQQILFFRELDFPLGEIRAILDNSSFDRRRALENHRRLLLLRRERLDGLLRLVDDAVKGEDPVSFAEFDMTPIKKAQEEYAQEARERWGGTAAYAESRKRTGAYGPDDWAAITKEAEDIYEAFAARMKESPASPQVQALVQAWQDHITRFFYPCSDEILAGLGEMYVADERFTRNIDKTAPGLAAFISQAIAARGRG